MSLTQAKKRTPMSKARVECPEEENKIMTGRFSVLQSDSDDCPHLQRSRVAIT